MTSRRLRSPSRLVKLIVALACASAPPIAAAQGGYPPPPHPTQQPYSPPQGPQQGFQGAAPQGFQGAQPSSIDELMRWERQDMGVPPKRTLHAGAMHGPTPSQIPGGQVITTKGLVALLQNPQAKPLLLDVLGAPQHLPQAIAALPASQPGSFNDATQQQFGHWLQQMTRGNAEQPLVFYCQGPQCWLSYNAALRAINLGYRNVLWYRGGLEAWQRAGLPLASAQGMAVPGGPPPGPQSGAYAPPPSGYPGSPAGPAGAYPPAAPPQGGYPLPPGGYPGR